MLFAWFCITEPYFWDGIQSPAHMEHFATLPLQYTLITSCHSLVWVYCMFKDCLSESFFLWYTNCPLNALTPVLCKTLLLCKSDHKTAKKKQNKTTLSCGLEHLCYLSLNIYSLYVSVYYQILTRFLIQRLLFPFRFSANDVFFPYASHENGYCFKIKHSWGDHYMAAHWSLSQRPTSM